MKAINFQKIQEFIRKKPVQYFFAVLYICIVVAVFLPHILHHTPQFVDPIKIVICPKSLKTVQVAITNQGFQPKQISVQACDTLNVKNTGTDYHDVAFGPHPYHLLYPWFKEKILGPGQSNSFILTAWGNYQLHDHLNENLTMDLEINH